MRITKAAIVVVLACSQAGTPAIARQRDAARLIASALAAQGGEDALRRVQSVSWRAQGWRNELEQSERPEGPYIPEFDTITEIHDLARQRFSRRTEATVHPFPTFTTELIADEAAAARGSGGALAPGTAEQIREAREAVALSPERLLLTAKDGSDLHPEPPVMLQRNRQDVLAFSLDGGTVRIFLNQFTHLPTAVDYDGPLARTGYWRYRGDVSMRTWFSFWWLAKGGIRFPLQWNVDRNGLPDSASLIHSLTLRSAPSDPLVEIPPEVRAAFLVGAAKAPTTLEDLPLGNPAAPPVELAPGIVLIPGPWNVTLVRQDDGIIVVEAPISSGYSAKVIDEAKRRFPGLPVKALVTTSDSWPHIAGIREYVARGIPIYCLDLNARTITGLLREPRPRHPDALQAHPRAATLRSVARFLTLGSGRNRMELYPIRGETSERQMMAYFPEHRLLYGSDPFQVGPDGELFYPQTVSELVQAVARERLAPARFFMMHVGPTRWEKAAGATQMTGSDLPSR